jgi:peptide/nickel transport system permease protein
LPYLLDVGWHMLLPLLVITAFKAAYDFLIVRNSVVSILGEDYILMAQAKGLSGKAVLFRHALRNALAPLVTVTAIQFGMVLSGALLIEVVFSWPGMGTLVFDAISARDYPLLQSAFFVIALCVLSANFIADVLYRARSEDEVGHATVTACAQQQAGTHRPARPGCVRIQCAPCPRSDAA